jgi:hypothetical protein
MLPAVKIFKITSDAAVVACSTQYGVALACLIAVAHIEGHCKKVGATPGKPMKSAFVLSASSREHQVLKGISTMRVLEYGWIGQRSSSGLSDMPRLALGQIYF